MLPKLINIFWKNLIIFYGDSRDKNSSHHKRKSLFLIFFVDNSGWDKVTNLLISINWKYAPVWINITLTKKMTNSVIPEKSKPWVCFLWTPAVTSVTQRPCLIVSGCKCVNLFIFQWKAPFKSFYLLCLPSFPFNIYGISCRSYRKQAQETTEKGDNILCLQRVWDVTRKSLSLRWIEKTMNTMERK